MRQMSQGQKVEWRVPGAGSTGDLLFNGYGAPAGEDQSVLEVDGGACGGCTTT